MISDLWIFFHYPVLLFHFIIMISRRILIYQYCIHAWSDFCLLPCLSTCFLVPNFGVDFAHVLMLLSVCGRRADQCSSELGANTRQFIPTTHIQTYWAICVSRHICKSHNWLSAPFSPLFWNIPTTRPGEFNPVQQRDKRRTEWKAVSTRRTKDHRKPGTHRYIWGGFEAAPSWCYYCWFVSTLFRVQTTLTSPRYWFPRELFCLLIKAEAPASISATAAPNIPRMQQKQTGTINIAGLYRRSTSVTSRYAAFCPMQIGIDAYSATI